jgi:hypothetical protein
MPRFGTADSCYMVLRDYTGAYVSYTRCTSFIPRVSAKYLEELITHRAGRLRRRSGPVSFAPRYSQLISV